MTIVVNRSDDRIVLLSPHTDAGVRSHAILTEEESFCASSAIRRMIQSRDCRALILGTIASGMKIERVDHARLPIEIHIDDDSGTTVLDLSKDESLTLADMLWGAHRATGDFHAMGAMTGARRRVERTTPHRHVFPIPDGLDAGNARLVGDLARRARGEEPSPKH